MRLSLGAILLCAALSAVACAGNEAKVSVNVNQNAAPAAGKKVAGTGDEAPAAPSVASAHGATGPSASQQQQERSLVDTAELDARINAAVAKAKGPKATEADKRAAADAYLERANLYRSKQNPALYKYALADFKSVLVYDPGNAEARGKMDEIIEIYNSLGRPVPQISNEK
jgi:hypothetical protein